jgi:predicted RNase H-like nuclease (RuvC/YqgF family)
MKGISMEIGDYGWIECKGENEKYTGWFLRAKVDGKVTYINKINPSFMFPDTKITNSSDEFILHYRVSAVDALNNRFPELTKEDMERRNLIAPINKEIEQTEAEIEKLHNLLLQKSKDLVELRNKLYNIEHGIIPTYKLVYGVHNLASDAFEYTWVNDKNLNIEVGDIVEVNTSCGVERIYVTKLEDSRIKGNHKSVVRKVDKLP